MTAPDLPAELTAALNAKLQGLSRSDAATLAAVLPNPEHYSAAAPSRYVLQRRDWILGQMQALGGPEMLSEIDAYPDRRR